MKNIVLALAIASVAAVKINVAPVANVCTNTNKATGVDEDCSAPGNSAWNTHTTARTGDPTKAQAAPYPDHTQH